MMGDPGPSDLPVLPSVFGNQHRHEFRGQVLPISSLQASVPTSSTELYPRPLPYSQPLDYQPTVSFRQDGYEEWSHRTTELAADDLFIYPENEEGAVTITRRDLEGLQPGRFLSDNIIDFYIKYMNLTILSRENQRRFHFFNSFFFTKLLESTSSIGFNQCKVDYRELQKWVGDVNLFEKDYIFIPIIERSHWSLIVICHLKSLDPSSLGEWKDIPCILHLDPLKGKHECFEGQLRSLILQAWMERWRLVDNVDLLHALIQMKYVQTKVPQQDNGYDCGLYVLHYIEVFLSKSTSQDFALSSLEGGTFFTRPNFGMEVSNKRGCIQHLIFQLGGMSQVHNGGHLGLQRMPQQEVGLVHVQRHERQVLPKLVKEMKSKKWKEMETLILLECMVVGGRFCKGKRGAMRWDLIAEEINAKNIGGLSRSKEQCQNRFDTLLKAYKGLNDYCLRMDKEFCNVTEDQKQSLKLATPIAKKHEVWYNHLHTISVQRSTFQGESHKCRKFNPDGAIDESKRDSSSHHSSLPSPPPLDVFGCSKSMKPSSRKDVYELRDCKLVTFQEISDETFIEEGWMDKHLLSISNFEVYKKLGREMLRKNPHLKIVLEVSRSPMRAMELCPLQQIRVLSLYKCQHLENIDLGQFPNLRCLYIMYCLDLTVINGWEGAKELGYIEIVLCDYYCYCPDVQFLSSLKECHFYNRGQIPLQSANFSHCVQLRRLGIIWDDVLMESMELKALKFLEVLSFLECRALSTIHGLSGLHASIKLDVSGCESLKMVPDLGCLKALTHLDMRESGIVEIPGVGELHLLSWLNLSGCESLQSLPPLGHLKALAYLYLSGIGIEEILGVEDLVSLETLYCNGSKLKRLPNLEHLRQLCHISIDDTPLSTMDPSRSFVGGYRLVSKERNKEVVSLGDISDTNDFEDSSSNED